MFSKVSTVLLEERNLLRRPHFNILKRNTETNQPFFSDKKHISKAQRSRKSEGMKAERSRLTTRRSQCFQDFIVWLDKEKQLKYKSTRTGSICFTWVRALWAVVEDSVSISTSRICCNFSTASESFNASSPSSSSSLCKQLISQGSFSAKIKDCELHIQSSCCFIAWIPSFLHKSSLGTQVNLLKTHTYLVLKTAGECWIKISLHAIGHAIGHEA